MLPGQGMGAAGTGAGAGPMMPATQNGISPQLLAMIARMQQQGGAPAAAPAGGFTPPAGPTSMPAQGTPMAGYIGGGGGAPQGMMPHPMMPQPGQPPGMGGATAPGATPMPAGGGMNPQLMQLLQQLKGQQGGVPANGAAPNGQPTGALPGGMAGGPGGGAPQPGAMAGMSPQQIAAQSAQNAQIGAGGSPSAGMTPQQPGGGINWQALLQHLQGGGGVPQQ